MRLLFLTCSWAWTKHVSMLISGFILFFPVLLSPEEHAVTFERLSLKYDSAEKTISSILQDREGFMWFGTTSGLLRFDGFQFKTYKHDPADPYSIGGEYIFDIREDRKGNIWIGTRLKGISKYDPASGRFTTYLHVPGSPTSLSHNEVRAIAEDHDGVLWFGTFGGGLNKLNPETGQFTGFRHRYGDPGSLRTDEVTALAVDSNGTTWIGTRVGLHKFDREKQNFSYFPLEPAELDKPRANEVATLFEDSEKMLWIGTRNGLYRYDSQTGIFTRFENHPDNPSSLSENQVLSLCENHYGELWIATANGLNRYDRKTGTFSRFKNNPTNPESLSSSIIKFLYPDRQGIIWIGTWGGGINLYDPGKRKFHHYTAAPGRAPDRLNNPHVLSFYESPPGTFWIGTANGGLNKFHRASGRFTHYPHDPDNPDSPSQGTIYSIAGGEDGTLWLGIFGEGLDNFDPVQEKAVHFKHVPGNPDTPSDNFIYFVLNNPFIRGELWIGSRSGGIERFDTIGGHFTHYKTIPGDRDSLSSNSVSSACFDREGNLWVGTTADGINRFHSGTGHFTRYRKDPRNPNSPGHNEIKYIHQDRDGVLWFGTRSGGLIKFEKGKDKWTLYTVENGLPDNTVYGILEDEGGNLWLSTDKGLSQFNSKKEIFINYDSRDGLQADEFNTRACFRSSFTGEMFFGGINGFNTFFPGEVVSNPYIPPVVITAFNAFNKPVHFDRSVSGIDMIRIPQKVNFISFEFASLNYRNPEKNQYAYKLDGFDKDWVRAGKRHYAAYTNLSGGEYVFRVIGSNDNGIWNKEGTSVNVVVLPPLWKRWWVQLLALSGILAVIYLLHRLRVQGIEKRKRELETLVRERTMELERERMIAESASHAKSDFLARMSHEIRTPLNAVIGFNEMLASTDLNEEQRDYVRTAGRSGELLLKLIDDILDFARVESGKLTLENTVFEPRIILSDLCASMRPRLGTKPVELYCGVDDKVPHFVQGDPGRFRKVLANLVANAVKFTDAGAITVFIGLREETEDTVTLHAKVSDTGIGIPPDMIERVFDPFHQGDSTITRQYGGSGLGLPICKQLSKLMKGDVRVESEQGRGSTFHFIAVMTKVAEKPVSSIPTSEPEKPLITPDEKNHSIRILLAEDNLVNQKLVNFMLTKTGYKVEIVDNGKDAVKVYTANPEKFALILMDIQMPEMNGLDASIAIREKGFTGVPIIALTAQAMKGDREKCLAAGMNDYLAKPIKQAAVVEAVRKWTTGSKS